MLRRNPITGRPGAPWQPYVFVALAAVAAPCIAYGWLAQWHRVKPGMEGWEPNSDIAARTVSRMERRKARAPIADVMLITAARDPAAIAGERVRLTCVTVHTVEPGRGFWTGQVETPDVFVADTRLQPALSKGAVVELRGYVAAGPNGLFVQADRVDVLPFPSCGGI